MNSVTAQPADTRRPAIDTPQPSTTGCRRQALVGAHACRPRPCAGIRSPRRVRARRWRRCGGNALADLHLAGADGDGAVRLHLHPAVQPRIGGKRGRQRAHRTPCIARSSARRARLRAAAADMALVQHGDDLRPRSRRRAAKQPRHRHDDAVGAVARIARLLGEGRLPAPPPAAPSMVPPPGPPRPDGGSAATCAQCSAQSPSRQPVRVPSKPRSVRSTSSSGTSPGRSRLWAKPFTTMSNRCSGCRAFRAVAAGCRSIGPGCRSPPAARRGSAPNAAPPGRTRRPRPRGRHRPQPCQHAAGADRRRRCIVRIRTKFGLSVIAVPGAGAKDHSERAVSCPCYGGCPSKAGLRGCGCQPSTAESDPSRTIGSNPPRSGPGEEAAVRTGTARPAISRLLPSSRRFANAAETDIAQPPGRRSGGSRSDVLS